MRNPLLFIIPVLLLAVTACKKLSDPSTPTIAISNEESANMIAGSLASGSNGLATFSSDISLTSQAVYVNSIGCGAMHSDSVSHQNMPGMATAYNYKYKIVNKLNCNTNNLPDNVTSTLTFNGNYSGPKIISTGSGSASTTIAGLTPTSAVYAINGTFKSMGSFKVKADTTRNGTIAINITVKNLIIAKATATTAAIITGGTATATITGNSPKGAFLFDGTLTFTGNNNATLVLSGTTYSVNLLTGAVVKQ